MLQENVVYMLQVFLCTHEKLSNVGVSPADVLLQQRDESLHVERLALRHDVLPTGNERRKTPIISALQRTHTCVRQAGGS